MSEILKSIRKSSAKRPRRSKPKRWIPAITAVVALVSLFALYASVRAVVFHESLRIARVDVSGVERLDGERIERWLARLEGRPILLLDLGEVRRKVEEVPGVESAVIARRLPGLIQVSVRERRAVARLRIDGRTLCCDKQGLLFVPRRALPGDERLPWIVGLRTRADETRLSRHDLPALRALEALERITGEAPPAGTTVDLTPEDRIVLRPGKDAAPLWLDRKDPELNLENLFAYKPAVARVARGSAVDLRFPHRLTIVPLGDRPVER